VGFIGSEKIILEIKNKICEFLKNELKLDLNLEKTKVTDLLHDKGYFLGYYFRIHKPKESRFTLRNSYNKIRKTKISHNRM
jgi:hypothetical protein